MFIMSHNSMPMTFIAESSTAPVVLKVVPVTGAAFSGFTIDHFVRLSFPIPTRAVGTVGGGMCDIICDVRYYMVQEVWDGGI